MIEMHGMKELLAKLDRLEKAEKMDKIKATVRAAGLYIKGLFAKYPTQRKITRESVYGSPFVSDRQRRWFFAALGSGELEIPYHRGKSGGSEAFGRSWTIKEEDDGMTVVVGNDTSYGPFLMGDEQSLFMEAMGWDKIDDIFTDKEDYIVGKIQKALDEELES